MEVKLSYVEVMFFFGENNTEQFWVNGHRLPNSMQIRINVTILILKLPKTTKRLKNKKNFMIRMKKIVHYVQL